MALNGSYTATLSPTASGTPDSGFTSSAARHQQQHALSSSISSLTSSTSSRHGSSHISKTYRQSSTLFLTRRLPEALTTVLPLVTPQPASPSDTAAAALPEPAPVSRASRNTRIKVWSLYLTILNAIAELDADEGKTAFGAPEWRQLVAKVREGAVWDEVVRDGYHGVEGDVDADVVINLATLLLAHSPDQRVNQARLESYLAACSGPPSFEGVARRMQQSPRIAPRYRSPAKGPGGLGGGGGGGADTPRDLNARVKILELFTLHVLIRNDEWDYAREFISASGVLDEERREAFLQALQSLKEEQDAETERREEAARVERERQEEEARKEREREEKARKEKELAEKKARDAAAANEEKRPGSRGSGSSKAKRRESKSSNGSAGSKAKSSKSGRSRGKSPKAKGQGSSLASRAAFMLSNIGAALESMGSTLKTNPMLVLRTLGFILGILLVFGRKDIRQRLARLFGQSWNKVLATAGMGVKVSYI